MKKSGFTLIELLAVIVILAVIALIATPIIINAIEEAKKDSAYSYMNALLNIILQEHTLMMIQLMIYRLMENLLKRKIKFYYQVLL